MRKTTLTFASALLLLGAKATAQNYNYADALQKSIFFYEAQRSGPLPSNNRINWRSNSALQDGADVGKDLTGGWYDAGDHVKFNLPMAYSATMLAWSIIDYQQGYVKAGQLPKIKESLRWATDYLIKCHTAPNELYGQVGNGGTDHSWWGPAEVNPTARPSYKVDAAHPGTDLASETAAALSAASIVFASDDPAYSQLLLSHAKQLYTFADTYRGKYSDAIPDAQAYYNSWSGYQDELVWGAAWLYRATGDAAYLTKAQSEYTHLGTVEGSTDHSFSWTSSWDDKSYASYVLMAKLTGQTQYKQDAERWLDYWSVGYNGQRVKYTPGGLAWLDMWGSLRYAATTSFMAFVYSDYITDPTKKQRYYDFAKGQIHYILGKNPGNRSFVVGFGNNPPINPHHRTAHGSWYNNLATPTNNRHIIYGALVGGPDLYDNYQDDRANYVSNEVACDYNAGFTGAIARLTQEFGGTPLAIAPETATGEFAAEAKVNQTGSSNNQAFFEPAVQVFNRTAWPARVTPNLTVRYFIDISEGLAKGYSSSNYSVTGNYIQSGALNGGLKQWSGSIYYAEVQFANANMFPGGQSESRLEAQFRFFGPADAFDISNDWSSAGLTGASSPTDNIAIYENGVLKGGHEPGGTGPVVVNVAVTGVTLNLASATLTAGQTQQLSATVAPATASNKAVSWTSSDPAVATVSASGLVTAVAVGSATITVTTQDGNKTASAQLTINAVSNPNPPTPPTTATGPYKGVIALPGVVEAEDFDKGGEGVGYHDTTPTNLLGAYRPDEAVDIEPTNGGGFNLGFSDNGEWLKYSVNVAQAGTYQLVVRYAAPAAGGAFHFELDGQALGTGFRISNEQVTGGWQNWALISQQVSLPAGAHTLRYVIDSKEYNTDKITFNFVTPPTPPTTTISPFAGPISIPGTLEPENYDNGGEGLAYHDTEAANLGGAYRPKEGVDLAPINGGTLVGWINQGEWLKYSVNVASEGLYGVEARVSGYSGGVFHLEQDGIDVSGAISVTGKNDWATLTSVTATAKLTAGAHVLRVVFDAGNAVFNLESLKFTAPTTTGGGGGTTTSGTPVAGQVYQLRNRHSQQMLEIGGASSANGAKANQWPANDCLCQRWRLDALGGGYYRLVAQHSQQSLEIGGASYANGAAANQWPANDCACQQWQLEATSDGYYRLKVHQSGQYLEIANSSSVNGAPANQFSLTGADCQEWAFVPVSAARGTVAKATPPTSTTAAAATAELNLSPNPANEQVRVDWTGLTGDVNVSVRDLQGRLVLEQVGQGASHQLRTTSLSNGVYVLSVRSGKTTLRTKLVVTH